MKVMAQRPREVQLQVDALLVQGQAGDLGHLLQPAHQRLYIAFFGQRLRALMGTIAAAAQLASGQRMANRLGPVLVFGQPVTSAFMQVHHVNIAVLQALAQGLDKQGVVTKPVALAVQRKQKQIVPFNLGQHVIRVVVLCHGIAQRRREAPEDRGL